MGPTHGKVSLRRGKLLKRVQFGVLEMGGRFAFVVISGYLTSFQAKLYLHRKICPTMLWSVHSLMKTVLTRMKNECEQNFCPMRPKPSLGFLSAHGKPLTG